MRCYYDQNLCFCEMKQYFLNGIALEWRDEVGRGTHLTTEITALHRKDDRESGREHAYEF